MSKVIKIIADNSGLFLKYTPDVRGINWVTNFLDNDEEVHIKRTFHVSKEHVSSIETNELSDEWTGEESIRFKIGTLEGDYYVIDKDILAISYVLKIHKNQNITHKYFVANPNISVFRRIEKLEPEVFIIGGPLEGALPVEIFNELINKFPTLGELTKYALARISSVIRDYVETKKDAVQDLTAYIDKKLTKKPEDIVSNYLNYEITKFNYLIVKLKAMLLTEDQYPESAWQDEILQIIRLMYPKYIHAFKEVPLRDSYKDTTRKVDIVLVDASGYIDIIEIKKPFESCIMSKSRYRDNHIPLRDLSGTVMQIEKYILHFNKWGLTGEEALMKKYQDKLPPNFKVKITNPHGIIIMGRSNNLTAEQLVDFEILKRKYKNLVDIITYDDLIARLEFILSQFEKVEFITNASH